MSVISLKSGSSPQVRGKPISSITSLTQIRLIPAGAGKTTQCIRLLALSTAHPRRSGENTFKPPRIIGVGGSSPQVRGKLHQTADRVSLIRLIPAGAGKTRAAAFAPSSVPAHPRRCGENNNLPSIDGGDDGSSPQVRGKPRPQETCSLDVRLIPAGAGKTP